jgi:8-oxo-dGTP diphosphatase
MSLQFVEKEQFWYISAFLNTDKQNPTEKSNEIEKLIKSKLANLTDTDISRKNLRDDILDIVKNISIRCKWVPYLENFPYRDENSDFLYNTLGYFELKVDYFQDNPAEKGSLKPNLIQQIPYIVLSILKKYAKKRENKGLYLDIESPIYVFVTSDKVLPEDILWTEENIEKHKRVIGDWTEIYSGQWKDYSERLYNQRIQNNLSNRLSELHFIHRNSGFVYMAEENYRNFFESYMIPFVLDPTPRMRAVLFALRSINESLDLLFLKTQSEAFRDLGVIERKISNLRLLRGLIQTNLSSIYNELDYNRRQHYTRVLKHLLTEFEIQNIVSRVNEKFSTIYDAIQGLYQKKNEENQKRTERGLSLLNLLFGAGVLADLAGLIMVTFAMQEGAIDSTFLNGFIALIISVILFVTIGYYVYARYKKNKAEVNYTIDAVILTEDNSIILIKRRYPPFQDYYALPGGFINKGETPKQALFREVKEETNLNVKIISKIGYYKEEGRDPRGRVETTAFKCSIIGDKSIMRSGDDSKHVEIISKDQLNEIELAFDHAKILKDAGVLQ